MHTKFHSTVFAAVAATAMAAFGAVTTKSITSDIAITLDTAVEGNNRAVNTSDSNPNIGGGDGYNLVCSDGVTITLAPATTPGLNRFFSTIKGDAGTVTLDLSQLNGAPFLMLGNLHFGASATLHIKGTNTVCFGSDLSWPSYYPTFNVPYAVEFDEGVDGKIVFQDQCCLYALPAGMTYEIASGANVAVHNNALGVSGDYTMTDFDISIFDSTGGDGTGSTTSFPANTTITVPTGRTLNIFPCKVNAELRWTRTGGIIANNINLAGGAIAIHVNQWPVNINGALCGTGTIRRGWTFSNWTSANQTTVAGPVALTNAVVDLLGRNSSSSQGMNLTLSKLLPGSSFASISLHKTVSSVATEMCTLKFNAATSADYTGKPIVITSLVGGRLSDGTLDSYVPLSITSASGGMKVNNRAGAVFGAIDPAADVSVLQPGSATLPAGWSSYWDADGYAHLYRLEDGDTFDAGSKSPVAGSDIVATNAISVTGANAMFRVTSAQGGDVTLYQSSGTRMQVVADGGRINLRRAFADWHTLPVLWLDASAAASVSNVVTHYEDSYPASKGEADSKLLAMNQTICYTNGYPYVNGWYDCRSSQTTYKMWNNRYDNPFNGHHNVMFRVFPYRVTGGLNGMDYISFGVGGSTKFSASFTYEDGTSGSFEDTAIPRLFLSSYSAVTEGGIQPSFKARYAFMVFGSQQGGGQALLANQSKLYSRGGNTLASPIFTNKTLEAWVDGVKVDPTQGNLLNGGWQVITLGIKNNVVYGLGFDYNDMNTNGGQNYAEVIFVTEELTDMQRQTIEIALAEKWGLAGQYNYPAWAAEAVSSVYGSSGTVSLDTDARLTGAFSGTIELNGHGLEIVGDALPPDDSAIATGNMIGWFDPDAQGKTKEVDNCTFRGDRRDKNPDHDTFPKDPSLRMNYLWDRLNASYRQGDYCLYSLGDRAPYLNTALRGVGPMRKWMDFANLTMPDDVDLSLYASFNNGNVLRFSKITNVSTGTGDGQSYTRPVKTIMMAQDSVRGGGQPFADGTNVNNPTLYKSRTAGSGTASLGMPIYPSGTDKILTEGKTYLDGEEVDGTVFSFRGRPEVLTVIPTNTFNVIAIGQLGNSQARSIADGNTTAEIIGEIMMWNCALDDASRKTAEAYLSWKWLGTTTEGYSALTNATVTGTGSVKAANASVLPKFAAGCTADVTLDNGDMAFTLEGNMFSGTLDFGGTTLNLPASCTITVALSGKPALGDYTLLSCGGIAEGTTFTFETTGYGAAKTKFEVAEGRVVLHVVPRGITIDFK